MLPDAALAQLQSIPALLSERYWTPRADPGSGVSGVSGGDARRGVLLLFAGSAGTGKTMAAQVLAAEMGLPILGADLEAVYAAGRGEAARMMARLFANAQRLGAVLELDQADFILSSAVASERPLSIRVADADLRDLLERCESHPGVVVFPTTRMREIDEVVRASTDATIEFPFPETPARAAIWRRSLAPGAAVSPADIDDLARSFQLPGQAIATSCAAAGQAARSEGVPVSLAHIARALEQEYATRLVSDTTRAALERLHGRPVSRAPRASAPVGLAAMGPGRRSGRSWGPRQWHPRPPRRPNPWHRRPCRRPTRRPPRRPNPCRRRGARGGRRRLSRWHRRPRPRPNPWHRRPRRRPNPALRWRSLRRCSPLPRARRPSQTLQRRRRLRRRCTRRRPRQRATTTRDPEPEPELASPAAGPPEPVASPAAGPQAGDELAPPAHPPQAAAPEPPHLGRRGD